MIDLDNPMSLVLWLVALVGVVIVAFLVTRLLGGNVKGRRGSRLGIAEYHEIDKARRLVLVRRDDVEHLILIGGPQDVVIESGINGPSHAANSKVEDAFQRRPAPAIATARPAPRPSFGAPKPITPRNPDDEPTL